MKNYQTSKWTATCLLVIHVCLSQILLSQTDTKISARAKQVIDSTYNSLLEKYKVVGASIAIVDHGEVVYATGYGFADREKQVKADETTIFRIGSCTKSFTALSIMQLQEKGLLNTNTSIRNYLPELTIASRFKDPNPIFIKDVLCHASGLPSDLSNGFFCDNPPSINWVVNELNKQQTISPRLYIHAYSNIGYGLLGEVIARVSGTSYSNYVKEKVFGPLHMTSSYIEHDEKLAANFSKGYLNGKEIKEPLIRDQAAGLIHSNALDMANYVSMYVNRGRFNNTQLVSAEAIADMEKNRMDSVLLSSDSNWGYGLYSDKASIDSTQLTIIGHGGDTFAFHADFAYIPELGLGVVVLTNTDNGNSIKSAKKLLRIYLKEVKSQTIKYNVQASVSKTVAMEQACTEQEMIGCYNFGNLVMNVKSAKKIKFKQGPATLKLLPQKDKVNTYALRARVYKVIPIKVKGVGAKFVKLNGQVYFKQMDTRNNAEAYATVKSATTIAVPDTWKTACGKYNIVNSYYTCVDCVYGNAEGMTLSVSMEKGCVVMTTKGKTPDIKGKEFLTVLSEDTAVTGGIGRGTGETVKILPNGNIYYSGFEFSRSN